MKQYEVVWEIQNSCGNNQMRDISFEEIKCDSPLNYVKQKFPGKEIEISEDRRADGSVVIFAAVDSLNHKFVFSEF